jgi:hypothetical protein
MTFGAPGLTLWVNSNRKEVVMRRRVELIVVAALIVPCAGQVALAQVDWTEPVVVVEPGPPGSWNSAGHFVGDVVFDGTNYHMFLSGGQCQLPWDCPHAVGHWFASDLAGPWTEDPNNPVLEPGDPGDWDAYTIYELAVHYDGSSFHMWYGATDTYLGNVLVGYATDADGWGDWTKVAGPLPGLEPGTPGAWDDRGLAPRTVLFDGGVYGMWYVGIKNEGPAYGTWRIGYASSTNGIDWTKDGENPVLVPSEPWEGVNVNFPEVVPHGAGFAMWYSAFAAGVEAATGYAVSPDGLSWGRWPLNPVLRPEPPCDALESPAVILEGGVAHGWFSNCRDIVYATSSRDVVFFDGFETGDTTIWATTVTTDP